MGLNSDALLIWGIPVVAFDEENYDEEREGYAPTKFWVPDPDEPEYGDWRNFDSELEIVQFGHYEDPDNQRGILTSIRMPRFSGDCWEPTKIPSSLYDELYHDKTYSKANDASRMYDLGVNFYTDAGWWLVASFG